MNLLFRSISFLVCLALCVSAWSQELQSVEEFLQSKDRENSAVESAPIEGAGDSDEVETKRLSFDDLPFSEYDLDFREWTDATRKFSVIGKFDGFDDDSVLLIRKDNGKQVAVKIELLAQPDAELLDKIKQNMDAVLKIREQRKVLELFADTRKIIGLLEGLRSQIEESIKDKSEGDLPSLVMDRAEQIRHLFIDKLCANSGIIQIPAKVLTIGVTGGDNLYFGQETGWTLALRRGGGGRERGHPLLVMKVLSFGLSHEIQANSIGVDSVLFLRPRTGSMYGSGNARGRTVGIESLFGIRSYSAQYGHDLSYDELRKVDQTLTESRYLAISSFGTRSIISDENRKAVEELSSLHRSELKKLQRYDWWGRYGFSKDARSTANQNKIVNQAIAKIAERVESLTGKKNKSTPSVEKIDIQSGLVTVIVEIPTDTTNEFGKRNSIPYVFEYQAREGDYVIDANGHIVLEGDHGQLISERRLTP